MRFFYFVGFWVCGLCGGGGGVSVFQWLLFIQCWIHLFLFEFKYLKSNTYIWLKDADQLQRPTNSQLLFSLCIVKWKQSKHIPIFLNLLSTLILMWSPTKNCLHICVSMGYWKLMKKQVLGRLLIFHALFL